MYSPTQQHGIYHSKFNSNTATLIYQVHPPLNSTYTPVLSLHLSQSVPALGRGMGSAVLSGLLQQYHDCDLHQIHELASMSCLVLPLVLSPQLAQSVPALRGNVGSAIIPGSLQRLYRPTMTMLDCGTQITCTDTAVVNGSTIYFNRSPASGFTTYAGGLKVCR